MAFSRRNIFGLAAAAPIFGNALAESIGQNMTPGMGAQQLGVGQSAGNMPISPRMEHKSAIRLIFGDTEALAEIRSELFAEQRHISSIDPDILVMKTWSPMAKLTFQKRRNVERALAELQDDRFDRPTRYVRAFTDRLQKLMWS